jgi:hypothetical protein
MSNLAEGKEMHSKDVLMRNVRIKAQFRTRG